MRLLFYIHSLSAGGAERVISKLTSHLAAECDSQGERQYDVTLLTQAPLGSDRYPLHPAVQRQSLLTGQVSRNLAEAVFNNLRRIWRLRREIRQSKPDVVIAFMPTANILSLIATTGLGIPVLVSERNYPPCSRIGGLRRWLQQRLYPRAHTVVAVSQGIARWLEAHWQLQNVVTIANGTSLPLPRTDPVVSTDQVGDARLILFVGRMVEQKQPLTALEVFAHLRTDDDWRLVMIGRGPLSDQVAQEIERRRLSGRVHRIEHVGNLQDWLERSEILLFPSRYEGFPNALLEAMTCGCAVVAYDCPTGPADLIEDGINGRLIRLGDTEQLSTAVQTLVDDETLRTTLAHAARGVMQTHDESQGFARWQALIDGTALGD